MINLAAKASMYDCSLIEQIEKAPINAEHKEQVQPDIRKSFNERCEAMLQFSSKLVGKRENSVEHGTEKEDKETILTDFANLVANNNDLWDEFIKGARESKIITNEGILLAFEDFRVTKLSKLCNKHISRGTNKSKSQRHRDVATNCTSPYMKSKSESNGNLSNDIKFALTERRHSCPQLVSFNEDIYVPEEESNYLAKITIYRCLQKFERIIGCNRNIITG